ncbi:MAG: hypothetical protein HS104_37765 [Polyangiaceae bacterium]|nr:hypothetical protein [Polyangiaceae bacterium]MCE7891743.1 hypothetical protein [Sorangiineae bacterium PRO1]MCL4749920.1 hypothetical protein [Myxococcales bacterium]
MKRKVLIVLLSLGTLLGYAGCAARVAHHRAERGPWVQRRAKFEQHVAQICADAALRARADDPPRGIR